MELTGVGCDVVQDLTVLGLGTESEHEVECRLAPPQAVRGGIGFECVLTLSRRGQVCQVQQEDETKRECVGRMAVHMLKGRGDDVILDSNGEIGKI